MREPRWDWLFKRDDGAFVALVQSKTTMEFALFAGPRKKMVRRTDVTLTCLSQKGASVRIRVRDKVSNHLLCTLDIEAGDYKTPHKWIDGQNMTRVIADLYPFKFPNADTLIVTKESNQ